MRQLGNCCGINQAKFTDLKNAHPFAISGVTGQKPVFPRIAFYECVQPKIVHHDNKTTICSAQLQWT